MVAHEIAHDTMSHNACLAGQHLKGLSNIVPNLLSYDGTRDGKRHPLAYDHPSDAILTQRFHSHLPSQIPESFTISTLFVSANTSSCVIGLGCSLYCGITLTWGNYMTRAPLTSSSSCRAASNVLPSTSSSIIPSPTNPNTRHMPGKNWSMAAPPNSLPPQANDSPLLYKDGILGVQSITGTELFSMPEPILCRAIQGH